MPLEAVYIYLFGSKSCTTHACIITSVYLTRCAHIVPTERSTTKPVDISLRYGFLTVAVWLPEFQLQI